MEDTSDPNDVTTWPTRHKAAVRLGIHVRTLDRMVTAGEIHPVKDKHGVKRYNPEEIDAVDSESGESEIKPVLDSLNDGIKLAQGHAEAFFKMVNEPAKELLVIFKEENQALREENKKLRDQQLETVESYQAILSEANNRELAKQESAARIERMNQGFNMLMSVAPELVGQVLASNRMRKLVHEIDDVKFEALVTADVLTPEQVETLKTLRKEIKITPPQAPEKETANEQSTGPGKPAEG